MYQTLIHSPLLQHHQKRYNLQVDYVAYICYQLYNDNEYIVKQKANTMTIDIQCKRFEYPNDKTTYFASMTPSWTGKRFLDKFMRIATFQSFIFLS
jgi:hypothetical protein